MAIQIRNKDDQSAAVRVIARMQEARLSLENSEQECGGLALTSVGAILRDASKFITEEQLPTDLWALLLELEHVEVARAKEPHNLRHWTSDRKPKKKS
jgi:hypothetical protein